MNVKDAVRSLQEALEVRRSVVRALEDELAKARVEEDELRKRVEDLLGNNSRTDSAARRERVLEVVRSNEKITLKDLAVVLGVSVSTVKSDLFRLGLAGRYPVPLQSEDDEVGRRRNHVAHAWRYDNRVKNEEGVAELLSLPLSVVKEDVAWLEKAGYVEVDRSDEEVADSGPPGGPAGDPPSVDLPPVEANPNTLEVGRTSSPDSTSLAPELRTTHCQDSSLVGRRGRVAALLREGKSLDEISTTLDVSRRSVGQDVRFLKLRDRVVAAGKKPSSDTPTPATLLASPGKSGEGEEDDDDEDDECGWGCLRAASREELEAEVARQQRGDRQVKATLFTTTSRAHGHVAEVDSSGDGRTFPDGTGHAHVVEDLYLRPAQGHQHDLAVPES